MYGGGFISGAGSAGAGAISTAASNGSRIAGMAARGLNAMRGVASASTWGATALATVAGMGSGTENALLNGAETFDQAAWAGAKQGAIEGAIAFTGGKLGERAKWLMLEEMENGHNLKVMMMQYLKLVEMLEELK